MTITRVSAKTHSHYELSEVQIATDTDVYASGDVIGAQLDLPIVAGGYNGGLLHSVHLIDESAQSATVDLLLFNAELTSTITDNAVAALTATEMDTLVGVVTLSSSDYLTISTGTVPTVASRTGLDITLQTNGASQLFGLLVSKGTPTYTTATALKLKLGVERND